MVGGYLVRDISVYSSWSVLVRGLMNILHAFSLIKGKFSYYSKKIIPEAYWADPCNMVVLAKWFLVGLVARLLVMPFAFHGDLLSTYHRSYLLLFEGEFQYFNPHEVFQAIGLWFSNFFIPLEDFLVWSGSTSVSHSFWLGILDHNNIFSFIFLLKIPYLLFDVAICIVFLNLFRTEVRVGTRIFIFWVLNPIVIFSVYIFGRYEVIPIFFIVLCLYFIKEQNTLFSGFSFGIAIISRYYALMVLPFFFLIFFDNWKDRIKYAIYSSIPILAFNVITKIYSGSSSTLSFTQSHFINYIIGMNFVIEENGQTIYVFILAYVCLLLYVYFKDDIKNPLIEFASFSTITFLLFYSTSYFHPHYFVWFIPFLAIFYGYYHDNAIIELHCLQVVCFMFYTFYWGQALASWMFASINPEILKTMTAPINFIRYFYQDLFILNAIRSAFSAISISMIVVIFWRLKGVVPNEE